MPRQRGPPEGRGMGSRSMSLRDMNDLSKIQEAVNSQKNAPWYIMHPLARYRMFWELTIALIIVWGCLEIPFSIAFLKHEHMSAAHKAIDYTMCSRPPAPWGLRPFEPRIHSSPHCLWAH